MADLPADLRSILVANADGPGPHDSKGIGESGVMPTAPAIASAIARAIGVRLTALPLTPERVWQTLRTAQAQQTSSARGRLPSPEEEP
jgi:CO/xanthine dehydrogenase Mo-binding subunit